MTNGEIRTVLAGIVAAREALADGDLSWAASVLARLEDDLAALIAEGEA